MIDRVTADLGRRLVEVPVGFKWFVEGLLDGSIGFGGEESAGASFLRRDGSAWTTDKDGLIPCLLAAEMTARDGRDPGARYRELVERFGESFYKRTDVAATPEEKAVLKQLSPDRIESSELAGEPITDVLTKAPGNDAEIGGLKVASEGGWFAARPSGTEDVYKVYAESFRSEEHLEQVIAEAQEIVEQRAVRGRRDGAAGSSRRPGAGPRADRGGRARGRGASRSIRRPRTPRETLPPGQRVVVVGGGFGGLQAVNKLRKHAGRGHADRPPQLPPLPAARLPGRHRRALGRGDRVAAARDLQARAQRAGAAGRGRRRRPRAARRLGAAADGGRAGDGGPLRHADRGGRLEVLLLRPSGVGRVRAGDQVARARARRAPADPAGVRGGRARDATTSGGPSGSRSWWWAQARPASRWRARSRSSRATRCRATTA